MIEYLDPVTGAFVEALIKSAASKTVELGVNGISVLLGKAVKEENRKEAEKIIREEAIREPVAQLVGEILSESYIVPLTPSKAPTADDVLILFRTFIELGIAISKNVK